MWLLNVDTLELVEVTTSVVIPPYAILSHRWGNSDDEITFRDVSRFHRGWSQRGRDHKGKVEGENRGKGGGACFKQANEKAAWPKIQMCCQIAKNQGLQYVWIDTCCINKNSSAALAEAINSMFAWYRDAVTCIVFLHDVPAAGLDGAFPEELFRASSWFTRGWTLQELIAPSNVTFYAQDWTLLGTKASLAGTIMDITNIDENVLLHQDLHSVSVAKIMSWAANRETEKIEDRAYSLAGLFGVTISPIYGEGESAFKRLQVEIMKVSNDQSLFAWSVIPDDSHHDINNSTYPDGSFLAPSPDYFRHSSRVIAVSYEEYQNEYHFSGPIEDYSMTNQGLHIHLPVFIPSTHRSLIEGTLHAAKQHHFKEAESVILDSISDVHLPSSSAWAKHKIIYACLSCRFEDGDQSFVSIALRRQRTGQYKRLHLDGGMSSLRASSVHKSHYYGVHMGSIYIWEDQQTLCDLLRKRSASLDFRRQYSSDSNLSSSNDEKPSHWQNDSAASSVLTSSPDSMEGDQGGSHSSLPAANMISVDIPSADCDNVLQSLSHVSLAVSTSA